MAEIQTETNKPTTTITEEVTADNCRKVSQGFCAQTGPMAALQAEVGMIHQKTDMLDRNTYDLSKEFTSFKERALEHHGRLETILEGVAAALKAEQEAKEAQNKNAEILLKKLDKIDTDVKDISEHLVKVDNNVQQVQDKVVKHDKRLHALENLKTYVYSGVSCLIILTALILNWDAIMKILVSLYKK